MVLRSVLSPFARPLIAAALLAGLCALPQRARADNTETNQPPELEDSTTEGLKGLQAIVDAADADTRNGNAQEASDKWQQAVDILEPFIAKTKDGSYDRWVVEDTLAKILWQGKNDPTDAIDHFLAAQQIADEHPNYLQPKDRMEHIKWIGQAYYQKALAIKHDDAAMRQAYADSMRYMKQYLSMTTTPDPQDEMLYSMLLYGQATVDTHHPDKALLAEAEKSTRLALTLTTHPKSDLYTLLTAELMAESKYKEAADYIELLVTLNPTKRDLWEQLWQIYNQLASEAASADQDELQREYLARAILAIERGQKLGYLKKPSDNYNLVTLYSTAGQTQKAVELLNKGLHDGAIDSNPLNWEYLANFYLQIDRPNDAIDATKDAIERFPDDSDLYLETAQYYTQSYDNQNVYKYAKEAVDRDHFQRTRKSQAYQMLAYAAYELQKYSDALDAVEGAIHSLPEDAATERQGLLRFEQAINAAIHQQEMLQKAKTATP